ncbi:hypothetical protein [Enterococcus alishanensis]|uniref:Uncharacterized protein n=1 Tax=Enterococcus alishanensis TaxID=1303817 RepID=A0ABS6TBY9_9ENTE|nr:hypothetical protein [Enterococcus alishanensis]MBV7390426.1 hypothetical protein [Enterococcus alishanensis]
MNNHIHLAKGWRSKHYEIPFETTGKKTIIIKVDEGSVRLGHHIFDIQNGAWLGHPADKKKYYILEEGKEYVLNFHIHQQHNRLDRLFLTNELFFKPSKISFKKINNHSKKGEEDVN